MPSYEHQVGIRDAELTKLGWNSNWAALFEPHSKAGLYPARISQEHRGAYDIHIGSREMRAELPGKVRDEATSAAELPAVGDWVAVHLQHESPAIIRAVLPRKSKFTRKAAWIEPKSKCLQPMLTSYSSLTGSMMT